MKSLFFFICFPRVYIVHRVVLCCMSVSVCLSFSSSVLSYMNCLSVSAVGIVLALQHQIPDLRTYTKENIDYKYIDKLQTKLNYCFQNFFDIHATITNNARTHTRARAQHFGLIDRQSITINS